MEYQSILYKTKTVIFEEINHPPMFQAPYDVHSRSRIIAS